MFKDLYWNFKKMAIEDLAKAASSRLYWFLPKCGVFLVLQHISVISSLTAVLL